MSMLSRDQQRSLGRAYEHGYEARRAIRLPPRGLGATAEDDLALALGFPYLVTLGSEVDDPEAYARERLTRPLRSLEPWPSNAAPRAAGALLWGWSDFPDEFMPEALEALASDAPLDASELPDSFAAYFEVPTTAWDHFLELSFLLEALLGGEAVLDAVLPILAEDPAEWLVVEGTRRSFVLGLGMMLDRLSDAAAGLSIVRLRGLLDLHSEEQGARAWSRELASVPLRAIDLVLNGAEGYERSARHFESGPDRSFDAFFLDRDAFVGLTKPTGPQPPHASPSVQWLVQGGESEVPSLLDWSRRTFEGSHEAAQRHLVEQWAHAPFAGSAAMLADMFARSMVKREVLAAVGPRVAAFRPLLERVAHDGAQEPTVREGASALLAELLPS